MGFQYAAKSVSRARDRSAESRLRAAASTEMRVRGNDSPGEVMGSLWNFLRKSLCGEQRRRQGAGKWREHLYCTRAKTSAAELPRDRLGGRSPASSPE